MTLRQIIRFFIRYKYEALFPVAVLEGPIISIIAGFLVSRGHLALIPALLVVFMGDVISDTVFYILGRGGRHMIEYLKFLHISPARLEKLENQFASSPWKTMIVGKVSYGLGTVFMVAGGASHMSFKKFLEYILSLNIIRSSILLAIGFYFGKVAIHIGPTYLKYYIIAVIILIPSGYIVYNKIFKKYAKPNVGSLSQPNKID
jgi:membrane protein DedA with SNARE-associated domain